MSDGTVLFTRRGEARTTSVGLEMMKREGKEGWNVIEYVFLGEVN